MAKRERRVTAKNSDIIPFQWNYRYIYVLWDHYCECTLYILTGRYFAGIGDNLTTDVDVVVNTTIPTTVSGEPTITLSETVETVEVGLHPFTDGEIVQVSPTTLTFLPSCIVPLAYDLQADALITAMTSISITDTQGQGTYEPSPIVWYVTVVTQQNDNYPTEPNGGSGGSSGGCCTCLIMWIKMVMDTLVERCKNFNFCLYYLSI